MQTNIINAEGISCGHCVKTITESVKKLDGIASVDVSIREGTVKVEYDDSKTSYDSIKAKIVEVGYPVKD